MSRTTFSRAGTSQEHRRVTRRRADRRVEWPLFVETLEDRTLLASSTLSIANGVLTYQASLGVPNNLTVSFVAATSSAAATYTFDDTGETIALGSGTAGWSGGGTNKVSGPGTPVTSIGINTEDGNDAVTLLSVGAATNIEFSNKPGNIDTVTLGGASSPLNSPVGVPQGRRAWGEL